MASRKKRQSESQAKTGRPTHLTPEVSDAIVSAIRAGCYVETAAAHAGVSRRVVYKWLKRGRDEIDRRHRYDEDNEGRKRKTAYAREQAKLHRQKVKSEQAYVDFVLTMEKALADAELANLMIIHKAASGGVVLRRTTNHKPDGTKEVNETLSRPEWTAAAWRLERRAPERWGRRQVDVQLSGTVEVGDTASAARDRLLTSLMRIAGAADESGVEGDDDATE